MEKQREEAKVKRKQKQATKQMRKKRRRRIIMKTIINDTSREELLSNFLAVTHYRLVKMDDIEDGAVMLMIDVLEEEMLRNYTNPAIWGTTIKLDSPAIQLLQQPGGHKKEKIVYYHCIKPQWDGQCFVPLIDFFREERACPGPEHKYIVPSANQRKNNQLQNHTNSINSRSAIPKAILQRAEVELSFSIFNAKSLITLGYPKEAFALAFDSYSKACRFEINFPNEPEILRLFKEEADKLITAIAAISGDSSEKRLLEKEVMSVAEIVEVFEKGYLDQTSERVSKAKSPTVIGDNLRIPIFKSIKG